MFAEIAVMFGTIGWDEASNFPHGFGVGGCLVPGFAPQWVCLDCQHAWVTGDEPYCSFDTLEQLRLVAAPAP
jgi:hypothetical protein